MPSLAMSTAASTSKSTVVRSIVASECMIRAGSATLPMRKPSPRSARAPASEARLRK